MGLFGGQQDIDLDIERQLNELIEELDNYAEQGKAAERSVTGIEKSLDAAKELEQEAYSKLTIIESEIEDLKRQLAKLSKEQSNRAADLTAKRENSLNLEGQLSDSNRILDEMETSYKNTAEKVREGIQDWNLELRKHANNKSPIRQFKKFNQPIQINQLCCLGDLHGWAPGLINAIKNQGHKIAILGQELDEAAMKLRFPDPVKARNSGRDLPKIGLSNHPLRPNSFPTPFLISDLLLLMIIRSALLLLAI